MKLNINIRNMLLCMLTVGLAAACGGKKDAASHPFAGTFVDEFNNTFELTDDHRAIITFAGNDFSDTTHWDDGGVRNWGYATIEFNGDPTHFYLKDGILYRHEEDMGQPEKGLRIMYKD